MAELSLEAHTLLSIYQRHIKSPKASSYDRENIGRIVAGEGDWFGAHLIRLIHKADQNNKFQLGVAYPDYVRLVMAWEAQLEFEERGGERFPLEGKIVRLGGLFADPEGGVVCDGAVANVMGYYDQMHGKSFLQAAMIDTDEKAIAACKRFASIELDKSLFQPKMKDRMVCISIKGEDYVVAESEFGNFSDGCVEVIGAWR